ncbi:hypothetical protein [Glycomyces xiaoerkulensis]|uniref:hypothetical protein n=1 Tax=Glycomyces xiaoerkulensis TaxID=2038139 RepID=UPI0012FFFDBA|nr:hypothetical protein [Glycomyces xiaoerkulensis]
MAMPTARLVDDVIDSVNIAMKEVRKAMKGIPDREFGFNRAHNAAAQEVAHLTVLLEEVKYQL